MVLKVKPMSTLTDSFRLAELDPLTFAPRMHWQDASATRTSWQDARPAKSVAVAVAVPADTVFEFPRFELAAQLAGYADVDSGYYIPFG